MFGINVKNRDKPAQLIAQKKENRLLRFLNSKKVVPYVFVFPFIVSFTILTLYPTIQAVIMSFQRILPGNVEFIGLQNYSRIFNDTFYKALANSTIYMILTVLILISIPILLAILLDSKLVRFKTVFRSALFIPALTSIIVAGVIFRLVFSESENAIANQIIAFLGFEPVQWQFTAWSGMFLMVMMASWRWMGVNVLYFLAGLQNIPKELYESAEIDGAKKRFMMRPKGKSVIAAYIWKSPRKPVSQ